MSTSVQVETSDLRQALTAVAGHASPHADDTILRRVRLDLDDQHVTVTATNRYSAGLAIVSTWTADVDPDHTAVDLTPTDVQQLLAVFHGAAGKDGEMGDTVRLDVDVEHLTVTDTGGLFEGKSLTLPRLPMHERFPSVARLIRAAMRLGVPQTIPTVWVDPKRLVLFKAAGAAYGHRLILEATGERTTLVMRCGESFVGLLMPATPDEDQTAQAAQWRDAWLRRLPVPLDGSDEAAWLREGNGVTVSWDDPHAHTVQDDVGVSVGEGMRDDDRARLAAAFRLVIEAQHASAAMLKRKLRVPIAEARDLLDQLTALEVVAAVGDDFTVLVAAHDLDVALTEAGLHDAAATV